jgi:hypothetical protein
MGPFSFEGPAELNPQSPEGQALRRAQKNPKKKDGGPGEFIPPAFPQPGAGEDSGLSFSTT